MSKLTHVDESGNARMVDVSGKDVTRRTARASGKVSMRKETVKLIREKKTPKGDPLEAARLAGIMAAKRASELIPLCHPLSLEHVDVTASIADDGVILESSVITTGKTGAEMEALTAVAVAALTVYDMCKAVDREISIDRVRLEEKSGGKSGKFTRGNG